MVSLFLKTKLTLFPYSPLILSFQGVRGAGKNVLKIILSRIVGLKHVASPTSEEIMSPFNSYCLDSLFVHCDEPDAFQPKRFRREDLYKRLELLSGDRRIRINEKLKSQLEKQVFFTILLTGNDVFISLRRDDRRFVFFFLERPLLNLMKKEKAYQSLWSRYFLKGNT